MVFPCFFVHMPAITAMMLCQLLLRAAGTVVRRRAGAEPEETVFMAVIGTDGWKNTAVSPASHWAARRAACQLSPKVLTHSSINSKVQVQSLI